MAVVTLKPGDVFSIPLGDGRFGLGQAVVTSSHDSVHMVVFGEIVDDEADLRELAQGRGLEGLVGSAAIRLSAWAGSELVEVGHWKVLGNVPAREDFPRPAFKVSIDRPGNYYVEDWDMTRRRPATPEEAARLPLRSSFSAMALEAALKSQLGLGEWYDQFDKMLATGPTTQEMFGDD